MTCLRASWRPHSMIQYKRFPPYLLRRQYLRISHRHPAAMAILVSLLPRPLKKGQPHLFSVANGIEYPGPGEPPNVPPHTFGDPHDWGLSPWFQMCAVNRTALGRIVDAARTERPDRHALPPDPTIKLPAHLRNAIPPPSPVMVNARHR